MRFVVTDTTKKTVPLTRSALLTLEIQQAYFLMSEVTSLSADEARDALIEWAKDGVIRMTTVRFDLAKFFFSASTFGLGFIPTVWKVLYPKSSFTLISLIGISILFLSLLVSIYMFWPLFHNTGASVDLRKQHEKMVSQIRIEGCIWAALWVAGIIVGGYALYSN